MSTRTIYKCDVCKEESELPMENGPFSVWFTIGELKKKEVKTYGTKWQHICHKCVERFETLYVAFCDELRVLTDRKL